MSKTFDTPDHYASAVVAHLTARPKRAGLAAGGAGGTQSFSRKDAIKIVQGNEASVRNAYTARVSPEFLAARLARSATVRTQRAVAGLAAGMAARPVGSTNGNFGGIDPASFVSPAGMSAATAIVPAGNVVCPATDYMPPLFDAHHAPENDPSEAVKRFDSILLPDEQRELFQKAKGQTFDEKKEARELRYARYVAQNTAANAEAALERAGRDQMARYRSLRERVVNGIKITKEDRKFYNKYHENLNEPARIEAQAERLGIVGRMVEIIKDTYPSAVATNKTEDTWQCRSAIFAESSGNEKIANRLPPYVKAALPFRERSVATTYAPIERACPNSCVLKNSPSKMKDVFGNKRRGACYAQTSNNILPIVIMLDGVADAFKLNLNQIAEDEARAIMAGFPNGMKEPVDIRLHTSGDTQRPEGARMLSAAISHLSRKQKWKTVTGTEPLGPNESAMTQAERQRREDELPLEERFKRRAIRTSLAKLTQPMRAWTYTHAWANMAPRDWGVISCLASVASHEEARDAYVHGWAPTIVVDEGTFAKYATTPEGFSRAFSIAGDVKVVREIQGPREFQQSGRAVPAPKGDGDRPITWIPCPAQHPDKDKKIGCVNCRLCFDAKRLHEMGMGIAFEAHGTGASGALTYGDAEHLITAKSLLKQKHEKSIQAERRKVEKWEAQSTEDARAQREIHAQHGLSRGRGRKKS